MTAVQSVASRSMWPACFALAMQRRPPVRGGTGFPVRPRRGLGAESAELVVGQILDLALVRVDPRPGGRPGLERADRPVACGCSVSVATLATLIALQLLPLRRGVNRWAWLRSSIRWSTPSIQPTHSASSTASVQVTLGIPEPFL